MKVGPGDDEDLDYIEPIDADEPYQDDEPNPYHGTYSED